MTKSIIHLLLIASSMLVTTVYAEQPQTTPWTNIVVKPVVPPKKEPVKVVTTLAVIAAITKEIGGDLVKVDSLTEAAEDPHFVKPKPTFKRLVGEAQLFLQIGRSLELWVRQVLDAAANRQLTSNAVVSVSTGAKALEVPTELTREKGDIHPQGNPHVWLSALGGLKMAENIRDALVATDGTNKAVYERNFAAFKDRLSRALFGDELVISSGNADFLWRLHEGKKLKDYLASKKKSVGGWLKQAELIDYPFITYHKVWSYLGDEFDLKIFGQIEEKSGVDPSAKYNNALIARAKEAGVKHVLDASFYVGKSKYINDVAKGIGGNKLFINADAVAGETFVDMMERIFRELVSFKGSSKIETPAPVAKPLPKKK